MFEQIIFDKLWLILPLWLVIYVSDYYLTVLGALYYNAGAKDHIVFSGSYELTPEFQKDIDALRMFSPRFLRAVIISILVFSFLWYVSRDDVAASFFFRFLCGGLIVQETAILIRHARNIALFRIAKAHQGMTGQIRYAKWFSYWMSRVELLCFAGLFAFVFLLTGSAPFLGGALLTTLTATKHSKLCKETETQSQPDIGQVSPEAAQSASPDEPSM
jgi:hypothetical protein